MHGVRFVKFGQLKFTCRPTCRSCIVITARFLNFAKGDSSEVVYIMATNSQNDLLSISRSTKYMLNNLSGFLCLSVRLSVRMSVRLFELFAKTCSATLRAGLLYALILWIVLKDRFPLDVTFH